jgi:UDP-glucose 4-epimerase
MNILVFGGTGFIGSNLCSELLKLGHKIRVVDRTIKPINTEKLANIEFIEADFVQVDDFTSYLENIDVVFHLISTTLPATSKGNEIFDIQSNVCSTLRLLNSMVQIGNGKKIIFLSSGGTVYGQSNVNPIPEETPTNPICSYGIHKLTIEKYLHFYYHEYGLDYQIVRLANPYGRGQNGKNGQGVIPIFARKIQQSEEIQIWGDGLTTRDYIYIDDVIDALCLLPEYTGDYKIMNLGSGRGASLLDIVEIVAKVLNIKPNIKFLNARTIDVKTNVLDISIIKRELRWSPQFDLTNGIRQMLVDET